MNKLAGLLSYVAGPIDNVSTSEAREWRIDMTHFLKSMGVGVLNPCNKPTDHTETPEFKEEVLKYKNQNDYNMVTELMRPVCSIDLRMVDKSDFIIANIDMDAKMCGTIWELAIARVSKKPVLIHAVNGKNNIPNWLFGTCNHEEMFNSWNELKQYLTDINNGSIIPHKRWLFFDPKIVF